MNNRRQTSRSTLTGDSHSPPQLSPPLSNLYRAQHSHQLVCASRRFSDSESVTRAILPARAVERVQNLQMRWAMWARGVRLLPQRRSSVPTPIISRAHLQSSIRFRSALCSPHRVRCARHARESQPESEGHNLSRKRPFTSTFNCSGAIAIAIRAFASRSRVR